LYRVDLSNLAADPCPNGTKKIRVHGGVAATGSGSEVRVGVLNL
jgi:hypothetical protein